MVRTSVRSKLDVTKKAVTANVTVKYAVPIVYDGRIVEGLIVVVAIILTSTRRRACAI